MPAAATAALCFSAGGFFPGATAVAAIAALVALLLRITLARHPWEGWSAGMSVGAGALALFAVWTLVSSHWSGAPGRALLEFDRTLLYLAAFVVSGLFAARAGDLAVVLRWTAAAACGVCIVALATRLAPGTFPTDRPPSHTRLEFPLTYWNSLGALAAVGLVLALHVTSSIRQPAVARVLAAAAFPAVAVCLYFTFSRGGSIAAVFGVAVYLVLGYSRGFVPAFVAVVPTTAFALQRAFDADLLAGARFEQPVAAAQRGDLLTVVVACALAAALLRGLLLVADHRLARVRLSPRGRLGAKLVAASLVALLAAGAVAGGVPARVERQRHALTAKAQPTGGDLRTHLTTWDDNFRYEHWRVALDEFKADPLHGSGAGTFQRTWERARPSRLQGRRRPLALLRGPVRAGVAGDAVPRPRAGHAVRLRARPPPRPGAARLRGLRRRRRGAAVARGDRLGLGDAGAVRVVLRRERGGAGEPAWRVRRRRPRG